MNKQVYIISGVNGSGKTTTALSLLPKQLGILEYANADEIAKGISPFNPESNEDNAESEGWRIERIRVKLGISSPEAQKFPTKVCPICQRKFFSDHDLQDHIFDMHRHETNFDIAKEINLDEETEITNTVILLRSL